MWIVLLWKYRTYSWETKSTSSLQVIVSDGKWDHGSVGVVISRVTLPSGSKTMYLTSWGN